jgi:diguanylate cyclase (GGDEF)-like protein
MLLSRRPGTALEGLPVIALGSRPPRGFAEGSEVDETIPEDADDEHLAERLRVWTRWGSRLTRLRDLESAAIAHQETDALTGLPGHRPFHERLEIEVGRSERYGSSVSVLIGDVESMRTVNERYGHRTGDRVLREVGQTLRRALRQVDFIARYEGDRFGIILAESRREAASLVAARLRSLVGSLIFRGESSSGSPLPLLKLSILFGEASLPHGSLRGKSALLAAAQADLTGLKTARATPTVSA